MTPYYTIKDHLGSVRTTVNASGAVVERNDYYPFGQRTTFGATYATLAANRQKFSGKEDQSTIGSSTLPYLDFGARMYDSKLVRWNTYDPMAEKYYGINPYVYCNGDPVNAVDPDGMNPIYDINGNLLGTDDLGLKGEPIIMSIDMFKQGMSNAAAMEQNLGLESLEDDISAARLFCNYVGLRNRPDWDGYLTLSEANEWYRHGQGRPLFVDINKIDLGTFFNERPEGSRFLRNLIVYSGSLNDALVYGNITLSMNSNHMITVDYSDVYNFDIKPRLNPHTIFRNISTIIGHIVAGYGKPYEINIYGAKKVRTTL